MTNCTFLPLFVFFFTILFRSTVVCVVCKCSAAVLNFFTIPGLVDPVLKVSQAEEGVLSNRHSGGKIYEKRIYLSGPVTVLYAGSLVVRERGREREEVGEREMDIESACEKLYIYIYTALNFCVTAVSLHGYMTKVSSQAAGPHIKWEIISA